MIDRFNNFLVKHNSFIKDTYQIQLTNADMVLVIPVYCEDNIDATLNSIIKADRSGCKVVVLCIVNASVVSEASVVNEQQVMYTKLLNYPVSDSNIQIVPLKAFELPRKHFGAGLARKIGMDEAIRYFNQQDNEDGIIISLDADSTVSENYFTAIKDFFNRTDHQAASIYFEHPIDGSEYEESIYAAIIQYELHLRYYVEALKMLALPYAFHTVGSCFAVKADAYVKVGGMNRRQGGEEFYFLQKILQVGSIGNLNSTKVVPSPRISNRVPFGTGPTIQQIVEQQGEFETYNLQTFFDIKQLFDSIANYFGIDEEAFQKEILNLPGRVRSYLLNSDFYPELENLNRNCATIDTFKKRFYHVFNAFRLVKYLNYCHEHFVEKIPVFDAAIELLEAIGVQTEDIFDEKELLVIYRNIHGQN